MADYTYAGEVAAIAGKLIKGEKAHAHLKHVRIEYVFRDKAGTKNGKPVLGKARKVSGLSAYLASPTALEKAPEIGQYEVEDFFAMEIAKDYWLTLSVEQKTALVDHELTHFWIDLDEGKLSIAPHDLEEFAAIGRRHGPWASDIKLFVRKAGDQLSLLPDDDEPLDEAIN